ncbi:hypothetical protein AAFF_G00097870 [Aldrovandia affinis]|uniref:Secreted protein n=1 Tax=Aldrovandia affinis TaxID=143900 RepID=A0AAD7RV87_9TELE|nr:hypothetical protein AAFF_G00097870 [Aldrovandia affinis]
MFSAGVSTCLWASVVYWPFSLTVTLEVSGCLAVRDIQLASLRMTSLTYLLFINVPKTPCSPSFYWHFICHGSKKHILHWEKQGN